MEIVNVDESEKWNRIVRSFPKWDVYYLNEYAYSLKLHGDGLPLLVYSTEKEFRICYVVMQEDIAASEFFQGVLPINTYYDWSTPYGYGGPLIDGQPTENALCGFIRKLNRWCEEHSIVTQFFRFHPLLQNQKLLENICEVVYMKKTIYIDTRDEETIFRNMTPNNRNMVRKAEKNGVKIVMDHGERIKDFQRIYQKTMENNHAEEYYFFEDEYFEYLKTHLAKNILFAYAVYGDKIVSASIFLYNAQYIHYHLSGTLPEYRNLGATNLLLTKVAYWAAERGLEAFHLGGGVGITDSLLTFKKHFNRNGEIDFCIGRNIFDQNAFDKLVQLRLDMDPMFDMARPFLIKYRG